MSVRKDFIKISKNIPHSEFAVFLDRDGVVNEEVHLLHKTEDLKLIKGSAKAIALLNKLKIPVFLISNQTVLARGLTTKKEFLNIHKSLIDILKKNNAHFDGVIYCVHSNKADIKEYKKDCPFRKPNPGMIFEIEKHLKIVYPKIFVVGDQARDLLMANRAKAISILVQTGHKGKDFLYKADPDINAKNLEDAVAVILNNIKNQNASAVILAGGKGTRLNTLTKDRQKTMLEIGDKPLLAWQIENLARNGITNIYITLCYKPKSITDYLKNHYCNLTINTITEKTPKGTAGSIIEFKEKLKENFLVIYGDVLNNVNLSSVLDFHIKKKTLGTLVVRKTDHPKDSDLVEFNKNLLVENIINKPHNKKNGYGNSGIMVFNKQVLDEIKNTETQDFIKDFLPICFKRKSLFVYPVKSYIKDIGTPERYQKALKDFKEGIIIYV